MKKIFKKESAISTAINVGLGGAANVAIDLAIENIDQLAGVSEDYINGGKFVAGVLGSSLTSNRYLKAAMDGIATVGAANLAKSLMAGETKKEDEGDGNGNGDGANGVPYGTVGKVIPGHRAFGKAIKAKGSVGTVTDMIG